MADARVYELDLMEILKAMVRWRYEPVGQAVTPDKYFANRSENPVPIKVLRARIEWLWKEGLCHLGGPLELAAPSKKAYKDFPELAAYKANLDATVPKRMEGE